MRSQLRSSSRLLLRAARTLLRAPTVHVSARWLRFRAQALRRPPVTLNEKIRVHMVYSREPDLTRMADKFAVRGLVEERVGKQYLPELLGVFDRADAVLAPGAYPRRCAIKATHGSGATLLIDDSLDPGHAIIPRPRPIFPWDSNVRLHPDDVEPWALWRLLDAWLRSDYSRLKAEWAYRNVPHRILVEELLDVDGEPPADYKFWCVHGTVRFFLVDEGRFGRHTRSVHRPDGTPLPATIKRYPAPESPPNLSPPVLTEMLGLAEALAEGLDMIRVDLYALPGRVVVGELTNYPGGGMARMRPDAVLSDLTEDWQPL